MQRLKQVIPVFFMLILMSAQIYADDFKDGMGAYETEDFRTAYKLFFPLADRGLAHAQFQLGVMFENGQGVAQDYLQASQWYRLSADQGDASAQYNLGGLYRQGIAEVVQDYKKAAEWYWRAAEQGHATGQHNLGLMYYKGQGVVKDIIEAHKWFTLAKASGDPVANKNRLVAEKKMTSVQISESQKRVKKWIEGHKKK